MGLGEFAPSDIGNIKLWVKPDGLLYNGSNLIHQWTDASGQDNHLLQATESNKPLRVAGLKNGHEGVRFDGVDNFLKSATFAWEQPETIYIVFNSVTWTNGDRIFDGFEAVGGEFLQNATTPGIRAYAGSFSTELSNFTVGAFAIATVIFNGASSLVQYNDGASTTDDLGAGDLAGFTLGARGSDLNFSNVEVMEVIGYATAHDAADRTRMKDYLSKKYAIVI